MCDYAGYSVHLIAQDSIVCALRDSLNTSLNLQESNANSVFGGVQEQKY